MKYGLTRKLNLKRFFPDMSYETVDFHVEDCDTPEEATTEINNWIEEWIKDTKKRSMTPEQKFIDELDATKNN